MKDRKRESFLLLWRYVRVFYWGGSHFQKGSGAFRSFTAFITVGKFALADASSSCGGCGSSSESFSGTLFAWFSDLLFIDENFSVIVLDHRRPRPTIRSKQMAISPAPTLPVVLANLRNDLKSTEYILVSATCSLACVNSLPLSPCSYLYMCSMRVES